ncbi:3'-5' exonuclease [Acetobacter farinalis]|uniref:3'-5' exonuclease n=1 Tax=Acetobacter farinalis TaxID=1260984 RepID=A0ABT3QAC0_9PROT|nr:3'-5' exonuclease [Acetobacter farinalis]MCX2562234.1 3'-5' exonuclease [Acetobacter farinalis]NHO30851.1 hypothetical protein [Acetobacter farinalis]
MDLILDTETTGLNYDDVILEIGICDMNSNILMDKRIKPKSKKSWPGAERIHHISFDDVKECPEFPDIVDTLKSILIPNRVIIFNSDYDVRLLRQTAESYGLDTDWIDNLDVVCCMYESGRKWPDYANYYGGMKLITASKLAGSGFVGKPHSAVGGALTTSKVWQAINS